MTFQNGLRDILSGLHMQGERVEANETERLIILKQRGAAPFIGSAKVKMAELLADIRVCECLRCTCRVGEDRQPLVKSAECDWTMQVGAQQS